MWKILKSKSFWLYAVVLVVVVGFFSFAQIASRNSIKVKELPVALVNQADKQASKLSLSNSKISLAVQIRKLNLFKLPVTLL